MSTLDQAMNYLADHAGEWTHVTTSTNIGTIAAGSTKWITLTKPDNAIALDGWYISGSGNTRILPYHWSGSSGGMALANMASSATGTITISAYWLCFVKSGGV